MDLLYLLFSWIRLPNVPSFIVAALASGRILVSRVNSAKSLKIHVWILVSRNTPQMNIDELIKSTLPGKPDLNTGNLLDLLIIRVHVSSMHEFLDLGTMPSGCIHLYLRLSRWQQPRGKALISKTRPIRFHGAMCTITLPCYKILRHILHLRLAARVIQISQRLQICVYLLTSNI
jgi:hypothetical protein